MVVAVLELIISTTILVLLARHGYFLKKTVIKQNLPFLSFGKLRGSYGITGSDQIGDYQVSKSLQPLFNAGSLSEYNWLHIHQGLLIHISNGKEHKSFNMVLELGFVKDRILLNATYAQNRSSNQLLNYSLPSH